MHPRFVTSLFKQGLASVSVLYGGLESPSRKLKIPGAWFMLDRATVYPFFFPFTSLDGSMLVITGHGLSNQPSRPRVGMTLAIEDSLITLVISTL